MHTRLARTAPIVLAAALFAACGGSTGSPPVGEDTAPPLGQATSPSSTAAGADLGGDAMASFCEQWTTQVAAAWPPDASTAATLAPMFTEWAQSPELATVGADLTTVGAWLAMQVGSTTAPVPDADTTAAYDRIAEFVTANC